MRWSPFDPIVRMDPYPMYAEYHSKSPIFEHKPFHFVIGYNAARHVLKHSSPFSSKKSPPDSDFDLSSFRRVIKYLLFQHDGDAHKMLRDFGSAGLRGIDFTSLVSEENKKVVDKLRFRRSFDFIQDWSLPLSVGVTRRLLGMPEELEGKIEQWATDLARIAGLFFTQRDFERMEVVCQEIEHCIHGLIQERYLEQRGGFLSNLLKFYQADGLSDEKMEELVAWAALIVLSSMETTNGSLGNSVFHLLQHRNQFDSLKNNPEGMRMAIEELLRFDPPLQFVSRILTDATTLEGTALEKGSFVVVGLGAANRDERVFAEPSLLKLDRKPNPHIAFGFGEHYCFGARVARLEMEHVLHSLIHDFSDLELSGRAPTMRGVNTIKGFSSLEVVVS